MSGVLSQKELRDLGIVWPDPDLKYKDNTSICIGIATKDNECLNAHLSIRDSGFEIMGWNVARCKRVEVLDVNQLRFSGKGKNSSTIHLVCDNDHHDFVTIVSWIGNVVSARKKMSIRTKQKYLTGDSESDKVMYIAKKRTRRKTEFDGILDTIKGVVASKKSSTIMFPSSSARNGGSISSGSEDQTNQPHDPLSDMFKKYQRMFRGAVCRGFNRNIFKPLHSSANSQLVFQSDTIQFSTRANEDTSRVVRASGVEWKIRRNRSGSWTCGTMHGRETTTMMKLRNEHVTACAMWLVLQTRLHPDIKLRLLVEDVMKRRDGDHNIANRTRSKRGRGHGGRIFSV